MMGNKFAKEFIQDYMKRKFKGEYKQFIFGAFTYQLFMKKIETDVALLIGFTHTLLSYLPLSSSSVLMNKNFPVPVSIMFGEYDWMQGVDKGTSKFIIERSRLKFGAESNYIICPTANHDLNIDNPEGVAGCIINDLLFWREED